MDEKLKKEIAVFRYGVISDLVGSVRLSRGQTKQLLREKSSKQWNIPGSDRTNIGESTIKEWITQYKSSGYNLESLYPQARSDKGMPRAIEKETANGLISLRKEFPAVSLPVLLTEAKTRKIISPGENVTYSTLYRFLKSEDILTVSNNASSDKRRFEAEYPNDMWQSDVMHGPYVTINGKQTKTYLIAIIDDMSRLIVGADFYLNEQLNNFLDALQTALL